MYEHLHEFRILAWGHSTCNVFGDLWRSSGSLRAVSLKEPTGQLQRFAELPRFKTGLKEKKGPAI